MESQVSQENFTESDIGIAIYGIEDETFMPMYLSLNRHLVTKMSYIVIYDVFKRIGEDNKMLFSTPVTDWVHVENIQEFDDLVVIKSVYYYPHQTVLPSSNRYLLLAIIIPRHVLDDIADGALRDAIFHKLKKYVSEWLEKPNEITKGLQYASDLKKVIYSVLVQ